MFKLKIWWMNHSLDWKNIDRVEWGSRFEAWAFTLQPHWGADHFQSEADGSGLFGRQIGELALWHMAVRLQFDPFRSSEIMNHTLTTELTSRRHFYLDIWYSFCPQRYFGQVHKLWQADGLCTKRQYDKNWLLVVTLWDCCFSQHAPGFL